LIELKYKWDLDNFLKASKFAYDYNLKHSPKRFFGWLFIAATQFGVVMALKGGAVGLLFISTILVAYWYGLRWTIRKTILKKAFNSSNLKDKVINIKASSESLEIDNTKFNWSDIDLVVNLENGFLIFLNKESLFIPQSAFSKIEDRNSFAKYAKEQTNYKKEN
jgi:hypothetical protein